MADKNDARDPHEVIAQNTIVMEDIQRQLRVLAEGQLGIVETLDKKIDEKLKDIKLDISIMKGVQAVHTGMLEVLNADVGVLKTDVGVLKTDMRVVKKKVGKIEKRMDSVETKLGAVESKLDQKADKSEHDALEAKVGSLAGDDS